MCRFIKPRLSSGTEKVEEQLKPEAANHLFISWESIQRLVAVLTMVKMIFGLVSVFPQFGLYLNKLQELPPASASRDHCPR